MIIKEIRLQNFRRFEDITVHFNRQFNILIGDNGAGKTTLLEAINYSLSNYFKGVFGAQSELKRALLLDDVRRAFYFERPELQYPLMINCKGSIGGKEFEAKKVKKLGENNKSEGNIVSIAKKMADNVRKGERTNLPVIVYYSNGRLNSERKESKVSNTYSRLEGGYYNSSNPTSNNKYFKEWYKAKQATLLQTNAQSFEMILIKQAVVRCIPDAKAILYNFEKGIDDIELVLENGEKMPFRMLSDGYRNMLALVADIAFRCVSLNPHLGEQALLETEGVVLIDELDLYLHPIWQKRVVADLVATFPKLQFITTTHAPLILASAQANQIIAIESDINGIFKPDTTRYTAWALEDILQNTMHVSALSEDIIRPILTMLDKAFDENQKAEYDAELQNLKALLSPNDPLITMYNLKQTRLILKQA